LDLYAQLTATARVEARLNHLDLRVRSHSGEQRQECTIEKIEWW
jgi:hypothetical protein